MIEARSLRKVFPGKEALRDVSFHVERGEVVGFLGPNGAGKTTTMRILTGFLAPTSGEARVAGFDVVRDSLRARRCIGYLPETNPLYPDLRVREYLAYRARLKGVPRAKRAARIEHVIRACGLSDDRNRIIGQLSKGLRQRVGLADAIVHDPEVLILDEPTIGLDPNQVREVRDLIRELGRDKTVILSTHILSEVEIVCRRVLILHEGRLVEQGSVQEIARRLQQTGRIRLEVRGEGREIKSRIEGVDGVVRVLWNARGSEHSFLIETENGQDLRPRLFRLAAENGWEVRELAMERLALEESFARLTGRG